MDKYIGRLLDGRYEILEVIGTGGMAVVYKARCHRLNRLVAIKILKDDYLQDVEFRRRFHAESQAVAMLGHPNIVAVYDVSTSAEADYIVMELIDGITLKQYMEKKGVLNWKETLHFAIQIAKALEHAHGRGIVHRDIKPHNIMVLKNGSVKVADFGIARMMSKGNTLTKEALGSVHYISPEQAKGGRVDNRSDIYSLGVVMYEMMCGRPPYDGESPVAVAIQHINGGAIMPSTLNPNIPGGMEQIIMKAMAHDLADRYPTATEMLKDMDEFRKDPAILFDYHTPPLDIVTTLQRESAAPVTVEARTTAERIAGQTDGVRRQPGTDRSSRGEDIPARRKKSKAADSRNSNTATIAIVTCSVVAVVALIIILLIVLNGGFSKQPKMVDVPNLIGENYNSLPSTYDGLEIKVGEYRYDDTYEAGFILDQMPKFGEQVEEGKSVFVTVSRGKEPDIITLESLEGMPEARAKEYFDQFSLDLKIRTFEEPSDEIAEGVVIRTDPESGTELKDSMTITLWISTGPATKTAQMPGVVGMNLATAINMIKLSGFNMDNCSYQYVDSNAEKDTVIEQSIAKNEQVDANSNILLLVSKGPAPTEPPATSEPATEATEPLITILVAFDLQESWFSPEVEEYILTIEYDGNEIYRAPVERDCTEVEVELTGSGVKYYDILINGLHKQAVKVDFAFE